MALQERGRGLDHLQADDPEARALEAPQDLAAQAPLHAVRFDEDEGPLMANVTDRVRLLSGQSVKDDTLDQPNREGREEGRP